MDIPALLCRNRLSVVDSLTEHIEYSAERFSADGNAYCLACVERVDAAAEPVGGSHGNASRRVVSDMLCHLYDECMPADIYFESIVY